MRKLLVVAALVVLALAGDLAARAYAEARTQEYVNRHTPSDLHLDVHIHSFPFVGRLVVAGEVSQVDASANEVQEGPLMLSSLHLTVNDVKVDRSKSVKDQRVVLDDLGSGSVTAQIDGDSLSRALGIPVQVADGALQLEVLGRTIRAPLTVRNGALTFEVAGRTLPVITLPTTGLMPCHPNASFHGDVIELSCHFDKPPARLVQLVNGATAGL